MSEPVPLSRLLRGCLEVSIFLQRGFDRFDATLQQFRLSLVLPYLLFPFSMLAAIPEPEFAGMSTTQVAVALLYRTTVALFFYLGGIWLLSWALECRDRFLKFGIVINWLNITGTVLMLPYIALIWLGGLMPDQLVHLVMVILVLFLAIVVFTARHTLKTGWDTAVAIALYMLIAEYAAALMLKI